MRAWQIVKGGGVDTLELAAETGVDAAGARNVARLFEAAQAAGDGDKYWPVIRETLKKDN